MTTDLLIIIRAIHFGSCLLLFGWIIFGPATVMPSADTGAIKYWQAGLRRCHWLLLPAILLSGLAWLALVAMDMSGGPLQMNIVKEVWLQTRFGTAWQCRAFFWLAAVGSAVLLHQSKIPISFRHAWLWLQLILVGALLGSLAWAGHSLEGGRWHLLADVFHLLVAGVWPMGLLPLFLLLRRLRQSPIAIQMSLIIPLIRRFSISSLTSVVFLSATGLINSYFLVGSFASLTTQLYGRWLLLKVCLFLLAVVIGAVNLLRLRPHLPHAATFPTAAFEIRRNVTIELSIATIIIIIVALLGILPPAIAH